MATKKAYDLFVRFGATPSPTVVVPAEVEPSQADPSEFERFEDLTARIVKVPKTEVDEKRQDA
jgi:hypothetical protein